MRNKLIAVQKSLCMIETRGSNTLLMADSLRLLEQCIQECGQEKQPEQAPKSVED